MDSRPRRALIGVAANPVAPLDLLERLVPLHVAAKRMAWRRPSVPDSLAEKLLATGDPTVALALDDAHRSSPTIRRRIAEHPDAGVRDARRRFVEHMISVGLDRALVDDLEQYAGAGGLAGLASHPDPWLREAVARTWEAMPVATRRALLTDPDPGVRQAAAGYPHPPAPEDMHAELLADQATRTKVASYAVLTPRMAQECALGDEALRAEVALNPSLPPELRDRLADDPSPLVRAQIILRQDTPEDLRHRPYQNLVVESKEDLNDAAIAVILMNGTEIGWLRALPLQQRLAYLGSPIPCFRRQVAASRDLPPDVVAQLDADEDIEIRRTVARRADVPAAVLERLVLDHGESPKFRPLLVEHPNFPPEAFIRLATNPHPDRRSLALHNADLPTDIVATLAEDTAAFVRKAAAGHPRIPVACLQALLEDDDLEVVEAAGAAPALPRTVMVRLLNEAGL